MASLEKDGWAILPSRLSDEAAEALRGVAFSSLGAGPGQRCLLNQPEVSDAARQLRVRLVDGGFLRSTSFAIQAIAFDKTPGVNWKVTWHQDVMFPFAERSHHSGYELPTIKDGIHYARPPREVLERMLAVRLHLDDCHERNGPLRVISGSHTLGVLKAKAVSQLAAAEVANVCMANKGDLLLMKPLLLHSSSPATEPSHRRVLHLVFYDGPPPPERWYREIC